MNPFVDGTVLNWSGRQDIPNRSYVCGYCGDRVSSNSGYAIKHARSGGSHGGIFLCSNCQGPTFFTPQGDQLPGTSAGRPVSNLPPEVSGIYEEARRCASNGCDIAVVMLCRKLLMHVAVQEGAEEDLSFAKYVDYLAEKNHIPPKAKGWVDHIRDKGNEANHEIRVMSKEDSARVLTFTELLLKVIYEFPGMIPTTP